MSAVSPTTNFPSRASASSVDVRATINRLYTQRSLVRTLKWIAMGMIIAIAILGALGLVDSIFNLPRLLRIAIVVPTFLSALILLIYSLVLLFRGRVLSEKAREVERSVGIRENALVTFAESSEKPAEGEPRPYIAARLESQARRSLTELNVERVVPRRAGYRMGMVFVLVLTIIASVALLKPIAFAREIHRVLLLEPDKPSSQNLNSEKSLLAECNVVAIENLRVRVVPPAYSGLPTEESIGDEPIRALAGSDISIEVLTRGNVSDATFAFAGEADALRALGNGQYVGSFVAQKSGALEVRVTAAGSESPSPIVRAVEVYSDSPPEAHITEPTADKLLRGVPAEAVSVRWSVRDDLGIADISLNYIRSRGEGDAAKFTNGNVSVGRVDRLSSREWQGGAVLELPRLGLQPGDTLVYWVEARDRNPSSNNTGRSASLAIAIIAPEPVKLNLGDLGPTEIGRFLLSERMIIIHTEKLHAERGRLARDAFMRRAQDIAAEQREFKNSFNEYINFEGVGSEPTSTNTESVEERVQEAEEERTGVHMHRIPDPPAGSPANVRDMVLAIRAMWDAEDALASGDTAKALMYQRDALTRLKRAQLAVRYIPPVFAQSKPIDLKRRYAGELNEIKTRLQRLTKLPESKEAVALRASLSAAYAALSDLQTTLGLPEASRAAAIARARERTNQAANNLSAAGGEHAATIAEALGQLRIVETELARFDVAGSSEAYAERLSKPLSLLTQATASLFAIAEARTRAAGGEVNRGLPTDNSRASDYFRRLNK